MVCFLFLAVLVPSPCSFLRFVSCTWHTTGASFRSELPRAGDASVGEELPAGGAGRRDRADHAAVRQDPHQRVHDGLLPSPIPAAGD